MPVPRHACPRCARLFDEQGVCPKGHGWLLDLDDVDDRSELRAIADLALHRRGALEHTLELLTVQLGSLALLGGTTLVGSFESYTSLWQSPLGLVLLLGTPALASVTWVLARFFSPRVLRARTIARALERTRLPGAGPIPTPLPPGRVAPLREASEDSTPPEDPHRAGRAREGRTLKQGR